MSSQQSKNNRPLLRYRIIDHENRDPSPTDPADAHHYQILSRLKSKYNFVYDREDPDFIIFHFARGRSFTYEYITHLRQRYGFKVYIILLSEEATVTGEGLANYSFTYQKDSPNSSYTPAYALPRYNMELFDDFLSIKGTKYPPRINKYRSNFKDRFCAFINIHKSFYLPLTKLRMDLASELLEYKRVDCAGYLLNNTDELHRKYSNNKLAFISRYKFTIAFENRRQNNYITEKIYECFITGSIPIYCGAPNINDLYNPKAFINYDDYGSLSKVIERIKEVDNDDNLYQEYVSAMPLASQSILYNFSIKKIVDKWDNIMQQILKRQEQKSWQGETLLGFRIRNLDKELRRGAVNFVRGTLYRTRLIIR